MSVQLLAQLQDLIETFGTLFPQHPSLSEARASLSHSKRQLDAIAAGRSPFPEGTTNPADKALDRPYSLMSYMLNTASATDAEVLQMPQYKVLKTAKYYPSKAEGIREWSGLVRNYQAGVASGRIRPVVTTPTATQTAQQPAPVAQANATPAPAPQLVQAGSQPFQAGNGSGVSIYAPTPSYASPGGGGGGGGGFVASSLTESTPTVAASSLAPSAPQKPEAKAGAGKGAAIAAAVGGLLLIGGVLVLGRKKGGRK